MADGESEEGKREWEVAGKFKQFMRWEREANPTGDNMPAKWIKWISISHSVCPPPSLLSYF